MYILGINSVFHDSSACIFKNGVLLAAAEDERFTQIKHGKRPIPFSTYELPYHAIDYCLKVAGITLKDLDHIAFSFNPYLLIDEDKATDPLTLIPFNPTASLKEASPLNPWNNLFLSSILNAPGHLVDGYPHHLQERFPGAKETDWSWHWIDHHLAHAASAYFPSPYAEAAVLTMDGRGERATTTYNIGHQNSITRLGEVCMPNSLGLLYEEITTHLGFLHSSDEYKVMALASYGKPEFVKDFREMVQIQEKGQYTISNLNLTERFGPMRLRQDEFTAHHFNIAHSLQKVLEESALELVSWLHQQTKGENLTMAGGVALNCVLNARIRDRGPFKNIWVQPASGDSGTALGAAMYIDIQERKHASKDFIMSHAYWGPDYTDDEIQKFLDWAKVPYKKMDDVAKETAKILAEDKIIGWFQGRMEYGPRALGSRSILASPIHPDMQRRLNEVKDREDFRPVAPVVLEEEAATWFKDARVSPYMLFIYDVVEDKKGKIPAVEHTDGTARIQTINERQHPLYYNLIREFYKLTGVPILVNTSFNTLSKPIVCTPRDAIACFWTSPFDVLVMGSYLIEKDDANKNFSSDSNLQENKVTGSVS